MGSDFLFARPSFLSGMARAIDMWGGFTRYNISRTGEEADVLGLVSDWIVTEQDLRRGLEAALARDPQLARDLGLLLAVEPTSEEAVAR